MIIYIDSHIVDYAIEAEPRRFHRPMLKQLFFGDASDLFDGLVLRAHFEELMVRLANLAGSVDLRGGRSGFEESVALFGFGNGGVFLVL